MRPLFYWLILTSSFLSLIPIARAHLMDERHGTLNITNGGGFLVLVAPESIFLDYDLNNDGNLSGEEFFSSYDKIKDHVSSDIQLLDGDDNVLSLQGLMLSLAESNGEKNNSTKNLIIMGRFTLDQTPEELYLQITLGINAEKENSFELIVTGKSYSQIISFSSEKIRNRLIDKIF